MTQTVSLILFFSTILKIKCKKVSNNERNILDQIEESCYKTMEAAVEEISESCRPLTTTLSPNVVNVQMHMSVFEERGKKDIKLATKGILSYKLCLNAETQQPHTQCDSSFTVIFVPNQVMNKQKKRFKNCGSFELFINSKETIIIPMEIDSIFTYSGFLLTHRQQIQNRDSDEPPFINLVTYHSKQLFENMMESFLIILLVYCKCMPSKFTQVFRIDTKVFISGMNIIPSQKLIQQLKVYFQFFFSFT